MKKHWFQNLVLLMIVANLFVQPTRAASVEERAEIKFIQALINQNGEAARAYLANGVAIPGRKQENRLISSYSIRPSGKENAVILIGYYNGKSGQLDGELIDFIWQLTIAKNKIADIEVLY